MKRHVIKMTIVPIGTLKQNLENVYPLTDIETLSAQIDAEGMLNPIEILEDGIIVKGQRRVAAVKMLGWKNITATIVRYDSNEDMLMAMYLDGQTRKPSAQIKYGDIILLDKIYKGRQGTCSAIQGLPEDRRGATRDIIGKMMDISGNLVEDYIKVGKKMPDFFGWVDEGILRISTAANLIDFLEYAILKSGRPESLFDLIPENIADYLGEEFEGEGYVSVYDYDGDPDTEDLSFPIIKKYAKKLANWNKKAAQENQPSAENNKVEQPAKQPCGSKKRKAKARENEPTDADVLTVQATNTEAQEVAAAIDPATAMAVTATIPDDQKWEYYYFRRNKQNNEVEFLSLEQLQILQVMV